MFSMEMLAVLMLASFFVLLMAGIPVALTLAISGFVFGFLGFGTLLFNLLPHRLFGVVTNSTLLAIPLFVFMGMMLERSRLAEDLMDVIGHLAGALRGGLGIGIILVGVLMGATTGIVGATVVTLGLLTLPGMLRRGYRQESRVRHDLRVRHARPDHPAKSHPDPVGRHSERVGRHAVRRGHDSRADAGRHLLRLHSHSSALYAPTTSRRSPPRSAR